MYVACKNKLHRDKNQILVNSNGLNSEYAEYNLVCIFDP